MPRKQARKRPILPFPKILEKEVNEEILMKFLSAEPYNRKNVKKASKLLMNRSKFNYKNQFQIFESIDDFVKNFHVHDDGRSLFVVFAKSTNLWVVFCLIWKDSERATVFYKDSSGASIPREVKNKLGGLILEVDFMVCREPNQEENEECFYGPLCLRNLKILLDRLGEDLQYFERDFLKIPFSKVSDLKKEKLAAVVSFTYKLSRNDKFKICLKEFLHKLPRKLAADIAKLHTILKEELEKDERDVNTERIEEAKRQYLQEADVVKLSEDFKIEMNKDDGEYQLQIAKEFPQEIKRMRQIFKILNTCEGDERFQDVLKTIHKLLGVDYDEIKSFNLYTVDQKDVIKTEDSLSPEDINDIVDNLSKKDQHNEEIQSSECTPLKELWSQIVFNMSDIDSLEMETNLQLLQEKFSKIEIYHEQWKDADLRTINEWAKTIKGKLGTDDDAIGNTIAIMDRAYNLLTGGRELRSTQILSVLIFFRDQKNQGQLCQIQTGEGKTLIVSLLAVIRALQGIKVDVITSNPVLAEEAVNANKPFYSTFGLTVASNNYGQSKNCYTADVLYGSISSFQFDYLTDTFEGTNMRQGRSFGQVILDEVDSMLIDNGGHIAKLASPYPGMESLKYIYIKMWQELHKAEKCYFQEMQRKIQKMSQSAMVDDVMRLESALEMEEYITEKIIASDPINIPLIPFHLKDYVNNKLDIWIRNALHAKYHCHEHQQYRLIVNDEGERVIAPVDYLNTGVTMNNTVWSNGLHQFVQLKHYLHLTSESLTSSFISNIGYIKKYEDKNIFGMTGTLGSRAEQELISKIYNVNYARIPTYKKKTFEEYRMLIVEDDEWVDRVVVETLKKINNERAVLVICETEEDLLSLNEKLRTIQKTTRVYANEDNAKEPEAPVKIGDIILATNIAGRGTDFRTEEDLESKGGLHVCVGFLPCNLRVEEQAFGRTSRQGNNGSAQLIVRRSEVDQLKIEELDSDDKEIKRIRDMSESDRLEEIKNVLVKELMFKDELFTLFSEFYTEEKKKKRMKQEKLVLEDLKEFWAFWLDRRNFKAEEIATTNTKAEFQTFCQDAKKIIAGEICQNPYYCLALAEHYIKNNDRKKATQVLERAIDMSKDNDLILLTGAYLKLFEVAVADGEQIKNRIKEAIGKVFLISVQKDEEYKTKATKYLQRAAEAIDKEIKHVENCFLNENYNPYPEQPLETTGGENLFLKHIASRLSCLKLHKNNIDNLMEQICETSDLAIGGKSPTAEEKFEEEFTKSDLHKIITKHELHEVQSIGIDSLFCVREVYEVARPVVRTAQVQLVGGISALSVGLIFLPSFPVMSQIAGTLISEGIMDVTFEVLSKGHEEFKSKSFMKSKFIFAVLQSTVILEKAIEYCQKLSKFLRECTRFKEICKALVKVVDKMQTYFEKLHLAAEMKYLSRADQLTKLKDMRADNPDLFVKLDCLTDLEKLQKLEELGKLKITRSELLMDFTNKTALTVLQNPEFRKNVVKPLENQVFDKLFEIILNKLKNSVDNNGDLKFKLRKAKRENIDRAVDAIINGSDFKIVIKTISFQISSKLNFVPIFNLISSAMEGLVSIAIFVKYATTFASDLEKALDKGKANNKVDEVIKHICTKIATEMITSLKDCYYNSKNIVTSARRMKFSKEIIIKNLILHFPTLGSSIFDDLYFKILDKLRSEMKKLLDESIRNCPGLLEKLRSTDPEEIFTRVKRFQEDHGIVQFKIAFEVLKSLDVVPIGRIAGSVFGITICSYKLVKCCTKFAKHLEQALKGGTHTNKVDEIIEKVCSEMMTFLFPLLERVVTGSVDIVSSVRNMEDFNVEDLVKNLPTISTNTLNVLMCEFRGKLLQILTQLLVCGFKKRSTLMEKLRTTPLDQINFEVNQLLSADTIKILQIFYELLTTLESLSETKLLTGGLETIFNLSGLSLYIVHFGLSLENSLQSGNDNNDTDEIVTNLCTKLTKSVEPLLEQYFFQKGNRNFKNETFSAKLSKIVSFLWNWLQPKLLESFKKNLRKSIRRRPLLMEKLRTTYKKSIKKTLHDTLKKSLIERLLTKLIPEVLVFLRKEFGKSGISILTCSFDITIHLNDLRVYQDSFAKQLEEAVGDGSHNNNVEIIIDEIEVEMVKIVTPLLQKIYKSTRKIVSVVEKNNFTDFDETPIDTKKIREILIYETEESITDGLVKVFESSLRRKLHENQFLKEKLCTNPSDYIMKTVTRIVSLERKKIWNFLSELFETLQNNIQDLQMLFAAIRAGLDLSQFVFYTETFVTDLEKCLQNGNANNNVEDVIDDICIAMTDLFRPLVKEVLESSSSFALQENKSLKSLPDVLETTKTFLWKKIHGQILKAFKQNLNTSIRKRTSLTTKLQTTNRKFIVGTVTKILTKGFFEKLFTQIAPRILSLFEEELSKSVVIVLSSGFKMSVDLNEIFNYVNHFVVKLDDMLKGGDHDNNVDDMIIEIEFNLVAKVSPLLENIYQNVTHLNSALLGKAEDLSDINTAINITTDIVINEMCSSVIDQIVKMMNQTLKNSLKQNFLLQNKLRKTSVEDINLVVAKILKEDEIRIAVNGFVTEILQKVDSGLNESVTTFISQGMANVAKIIPLINSLAFRLEQDLRGEEKNNDVDEMVEEICLDVATTMHNSLKEFYETVADVVDNMNEVKKIKKMFVEELEKGLSCLKTKCKPSITTDDSFL